MPPLGTLQWGKENSSEQDIPSMRPSGAIVWGGEALLSPLPEAGTVKLFIRDSSVNPIEPRAAETAPAERHLAELGCRGS